MGLILRNCPRHEPNTRLSLPNTAITLPPTPHSNVQPPIPKPDFLLHIPSARQTKNNPNQPAVNALSHPQQQPTLYPTRYSVTSQSPPQRSSAAAEELLARAAANQNGPPRRERILPSERIDVSGRPGFATSGDWPQTKDIGGAVRILSKNGGLTELGKRVEQERLAKLAGAGAGATSDDGGKEKLVVGSAEESSS